MKSGRLAAVLFISILSAFAVHATGENDTCIAVNPATNQSESVWSVALLNGQTELLASVLDGTGWSPSEQLTTNPNPDVDPHVAFSPAGDRAVAWWNDGNVNIVYLRTKPASSSTWDAQLQVSDGIEDAQNPSAAIFGGKAFTAYESVPSSGSRIVMVGKQHDPGTIYRDTVGTSSQTGPLHVKMHQEAGQMWVDWMDSASQLGWSEYLNDAWSAPQYEPYTGPPDATAGRERIRVRVLGL